MEKIFQTINVVKIVVEDDDHILMGRKKTGIDEGTIVLPGGKVKEKEFSYHASARELFEETSLISGALELYHAGRMIKNYLSVNFEIYFVKFSDCLGKIEERDELTDLVFYHKKFLPLECVYKELYYMHQDLFDGNKYYFEIYAGKKKVNYNKKPLLLNNKVVYKKKYPKHS